MKNMSLSRAMTFAVISALAMLSLAAPSSAQQARPCPPRPAGARRFASPDRACPGDAASSGTAATQAHRSRAGDRCADRAADTTATPEREKLLKAATAELNELSPWSMFMSADVVVKAVMIGLAFASLVTWTIFIAKMIELSRRSAQAALGAGQDRRRALAGGSAIRARRQGQRAGVLAGGGDARGAAVGGHFQRRRHQGARGFELCRNRARRGAADPARHGPAWRPSARRRPSSDCSAPSGAS